MTVHTCSAGVGVSPPPTTARSRQAGHATRGTPDRADMVGEAGQAELQSQRQGLTHGFASFVNIISIVVLLMGEEHGFTAAQI